MLERFRLAYRIEFGPDGPTVTHGQAPLRFRAAVEDVARLHGIRSGRLECKGLGRHARLKFSEDFPERGRQAIRNVWTPPTLVRSGGGRASG